MKWDKVNWDDNLSSKKNIVFMYHQILKNHSNTVNNNNEEILPWLHRIHCISTAKKKPAVVESVQRIALCDMY